MTPRPPILASLLAAAVFLLVPPAAVAQASPRNIPSTDDNQAFFALSQALLANGQRKQSSCGPDLPQIERCIQVCNSPGLQERGGCCCVVRRSTEFFVGLRGGCRYSQRVRNFTTHLIYQSTPLNSPRKFFDDQSCGPADAGTGGPCTCSLQWEADTDTLAMAAPLPTPSVTPTPVLTASASPLPPVLPVDTPDPTPLDPVDPTTEPTSTPTPGTLIPGPVPGPTDGPVPSDTPGSPVETEDPLAPEVSETPPVDAVSPGAGIPSADPQDVAPPDTVFTDGEASPSPEDDGSVCVDERYLARRGFTPDALVHEQPIMANVLCPHARSLPCGTPQHKLRLGRETLSYKQLCARPGIRCTNDFIKVNSVWTHMWNDVVHDDVVLTMFDVRYPETAQKALHAVMRRWRIAWNTLSR